MEFDSHAFVDTSHLHVHPKRACHESWQASDCGGDEMSTFAVPGKLINPVHIRHAEIHTAATIHVTHGTPNSFTFHSIMLYITWQKQPLSTS